MCAVEGTCRSRTELHSPPWTPFTFFGSEDWKEEEGKLLMKATGAEALKQDRLIGGEMSPGSRQESHPTLQPVFPKPVPSSCLDLDASITSFLCAVLKTCTP